MSKHNLWSDNPIAETAASPESLRYVYRGIQYVIDQTPIKVFIADGNGAFWCPYRLVHTNGIGKDNVANSGELIIDSDIRNPNATTDDVLDSWSKYGKNATIVAKDFPNDTNKTVASVKKLFKYMDNLGIEPDVLIPLQGREPADYLRAYDELSGYGTYFGVGGIAGSDITRAPALRGIGAKQAVVKSLLDTTDISKVHIFGQTTTPWAHICADDRIYSCDSNRFGQNALHQNGGLRIGKGSGYSYGARVMADYLDFCLDLQAAIDGRMVDGKQSQFSEFFQ